jgi:hypothetical protein
MMHKCKELTKSELRQTNGCGSSYWMARIFRIPKWISKHFTRCCNRHDLRYFNSYDKAFADDELYNCMYYNAFHSPRWQRWYKCKLADLTYWALSTRLATKCYNAPFKMRK